MSKVKDMSLAKEGIRKIEWVQRHMPVLEHIKKEYEETQPFKGITIGSCLHLEPKTINLGLTLQDVIRYPLMMMQWPELLI